MNPDEIHRHWAARSGEYSPTYYAHYGPDDASELIHDTLEPAVDPAAVILELGCSSGRHLAYLSEQGYEHLAGIELNEKALDVMEANYPDLAAAGTFYLDSIETVVTDFEDGAFDVVYSVETLQHIPTDNEWVFAELARITDDLLITVENEGDDDADVNYVDDEFPLYYRNWDAIFTDLGFVQTHSEALKRDTFRAFRPE